MKKLLLFLLLLTGAMASQAYDFSAVAPSGQTLYYDIHGSTVALTMGSTSPTGDLVIPDSVTHDGTTYPVTLIGSYVFSGDALTSVTIGSCVATIAAYAFNNCSDLVSVTLGSGVTAVGNYAFTHCQALASVTLGSSVASIGDGAFGECSALTRMTLPNSVTSIGRYAFNNCSSLASVTFGSSVDGIGDWAFSQCALTSVDIPSSVTSIGNYAFARCSSLTRLSIPNPETVIGNHILDGCTALEKLSVGAGTIPEGLCQGLTSLAEVTIGAGVTQIGQRAFAGCSHISAITCWAVIPPVVADNDAFEEVWKGLSLRVPAESAARYREAYGWMEFTNIIGATIGIEEADSGYRIMTGSGCLSICGADGEMLRVCDIQGRVAVSEKAVAGTRYRMPSPGIYLIQVGSRPAQKVVVR